MQNSFRIGAVSKTRASEGKMLVDIDVQGAELVDVPVKALANSFVKLFVPVLVGEQVFVFSEEGNMDKAYCVPSLFNADCKEPSGGDASTVVLEVGGNTFKIDSTSMECTLTSLTINADVDINGALYCSGDVTTDGSVTDAMGDLTNFSTTDGASRA